MSSAIWIPIVGVSIIIGAFVVRLSQKPSAAVPKGKVIEDTQFTFLSVEEAKRRVLEVFALIEATAPPKSPFVIPAISSKLHPDYSDFLLLTHEFTAGDWPLKLGGSWLAMSKFHPGYLCVGEASNQEEILVMPNALETALVPPESEVFHEYHQSLYHFILNELSLTIDETPGFEQHLKIMYEGIE